MTIPVTTVGGTSATAMPMPITLAIKPLFWAKIAVMPRMIARTADISSCCSHKEISGVIAKGTKNHHDPRENGIYLDSSQRNVLVENNVSNNGHDNGGTGIYLYMRCNYNSIRDNEVHNNDLDGIMISSSDNNTIQHNNVSANGEGGIHLNCGSLNNTVTMNNATKNKFGIYLTVAMSSWIYLNNFINNTENVRTWSSANFWNSRWLVKYSYDRSTHNNYTGNHWSDYSGNDTNDNGLGDEPYTIVPDSLSYPIVQEEASLWAMHTDFADADHYPLMRRYEVYNATDAGSRS